MFYLSINLCTRSICINVFFSHLQDQVRDAASEINKISGLPDSTLGLHSEEETTWDRTMDDIRKNFNKACHDAWVPKYVSPFCLLHLPTNCNKVDVALFRCIDDGWMVTQQCVPFGYILGILFNSLYKCTRAESLLLKTKQWVNSIPKFILGKCTGRHYYYFLLSNKIFWYIF